MSTFNQLQVGPYFIKQLPNGDYWIEHESGEGIHGQMD